MRSVCIIFLISLVYSAFACRPGELADDENSVCYAFVGAPQSFAASRESCQKLGYDLATIPNGFVNTFLQGQLTTRFGTMAQAWIGLIGGSQWTWEDGSTSSFRNMAPGDESPDYSSAAVLNGPNGLWMKMNLKQNFYGICGSQENGTFLPTTLRPSTTSTSTTTTTTSTTTTTTSTTSSTTSTTHTNYNCSEGLANNNTIYKKPGNGSCYIGVRRHFSISYGGIEYADLCAKTVPNSLPLSIHSEEENYFISNYVCHGCWIGMYNGTWIDGTPMDFTGPWFNGEKGSCAGIGYSSDYWYARDCTEAEWFPICKLQMS